MTTRTLIRAESPFGSVKLQTLYLPVPNHLGRLLEDKTLPQVGLCTIERQVNRHAHPAQEIATIDREIRRNPRLS